MAESIGYQAFLLGLLSAASLPLGALAATVFAPGNRAIAAMMAFGSGALLAALTIDLVGEALSRGDFWPLAVGCLIGGILFVLLNQWLNSKGGFLRKVGTTITHLKHQRRRDFKRIFKRLSHSKLFSSLPPTEIEHLVPLIERRSFADGDVLMRQGEAGDTLYIIDEGEIAIIDSRHNREITRLGPDDIVGEIALLTGEQRSATAKAIGPVTAWTIDKTDFDRVIQDEPEFAQAMLAITGNRLTDLRAESTLDHKKAGVWFDQARRHLDDAIAMPSSIEVRDAAANLSAAPVAIWLGIFLDGIPESFVIGSSMLDHASVSWSLIAGLFLSNFPEAFSSSLGMREQNYSSARILVMWTSLMLFTGIGAWLGSVFFVGAAPAAFSLVEGIAAGAMLTVIAETMLPEAYHRGGPITGISTLLGFLTAIYFTTIE